MTVAIEPLEVTYQLTEEDFRHGFRAWQTRTPWRLWNYRLSIAVLIVLFLSGIVLLAWGRSLELRYLSLFALGMPVVGFFCLWIAPRINSRTQYRHMPGAQVPITMTISDSGVSARSKHGDSHAVWSAYIGWKEADSVVVLFPQPRIYVPIPKRVFSGEQMQKFREILERNIGRR